MSMTGNEQIEKVAPGMVQGVGRKDASTGRELEKQQMNADKKHILLVDDEERLLNSMAQRISLLGFEPVKASSGVQALEIAKKTRIDLAIVDLKMPDMDGLVTITKLREMLPDLKTVLLTGYGSEKTRQATEALGAMYFEKDAMAGLWEVIRQTAGEGNVFVINPPPSGTVPSSGSLAAEHIDPPRIIGETLQMQRLRKNVHRLSELDCPVIIYGETGTGKELTARTIHRLSHRKNQRFLAFDCGCFSLDFRFKELVASLAPVAGSESNGVKNDNDFSGTIFLDHIENMPIQTQEEMLQILECKSTGRVVDGAGFRMDVRFIVAARKEIKTRVDQGVFNSKLYERIRGIELDIPPLRERKEDIPILCRYFLDQITQSFQKKVSGISEAVYKIFNEYPFPGNVRELHHIIERGVILAQGEMMVPEDMPERLLTREGHQNSVSGVSSLRQASFPTLAQMEQQHIVSAIEAAEGNKTRAAELLGISRAALWRKLRIISQKEA